MTGIIGTLIPGGALPLIIGGLAIAAVSATGAGIAVHKLDGTALAHSQTETANAKADLSDYAGRVAADAAKSDAEALAEKGRQQAALNDLQAKLAQTQKAANERSARLQAILDAAQPGQVRPLGPVALKYYQSLVAAGP